MKGWVGLVGWSSADRTVYPHSGHPSAVCSHIFSGLDLGSVLFLHGVCMFRECIYGECAHEQHVRRTLALTLTHMITAYWVSGNVVIRVRILICATRQKPFRKRVHLDLGTVNLWYCSRTSIIIRGLFLNQRKRLISVSHRF